MKIFGLACAVCLVSLLILVYCAAYGLELFDDVRKARTDSAVRNRLRRRALALITCGGPTQR